ncbi:MAG TPA: glutamine amidotransferase, partial [Gemmataceae bacterium]|nr:glutamine amidotransferase [Gemmataceae bacterium]
VRLFIDDKEILVQKETLRKIQGNEVKLITDAPLTRPPTGEIKVTLKVDPTPGESILTNNEISTYVTVTQEGISVLLVDQPRFPEPQRICDALAMDQRVRVYPAWLGQKALTPDEANLLQFDKQHYDVIILGDVTANRLAGGNPAILDKIEDLVKDKGTGLMMMGGFDSFGNSDWKGTAIERMLPVFLDVEGEVPGLIRVEPTPDGLKSYVMRQSEDPEKTKGLWAKLPELTGMNRLGKEKPGAKILAVRAGTNQSILVSQDYGKGRTLAFAGDTSWRWQRLGQPKSQEGEIAHARFWKQVVLWLAHQDETEGSVWIKPDSRRLAAGSKLGFTVGLRGKGGVDAKEAIFDVTVVDPKGNESPVPTAKEASGERGTFWKSDLPGEYKLVVKGHGKDPGGNLIPEDKSTARFLVYQDDVEMVRRAADHEFLAKLANSGGGKLHKPEDLPKFLKELQKIPLPQSRPKTDLWPDWRRTSLSPFHVFFLLAFSLVLCLEWFFRRFWGLV